MFVLNLVNIFMDVSAPVRV